MISIILGEIIVASHSATTVGRRRSRPTTAGRPLPAAVNRRRDMQVGHHSIITGHPLSSDLQIVYAPGRMSSAATATRVKVETGGKKLDLSTSKLKSVSGTHNHGVCSFLPSFVVISAGN
ncbi:hypothetical protein KSP40_PGU017956 [Platanthera guangdongensis]|uniref:Uncharacterized protein n=1 Tax=Platanthera guangdongensis TaxID=2320717 RepID=A0ABR2LDV7_9ASPA